MKLLGHANWQQTLAFDAVEDVSGAAGCALVFDLRARDAFAKRFRKQIYEENPLCFRVTHSVGAETMQALAPGAAPYARRPAKKLRCTR